MNLKINNLLISTFLLFATNLLAQDFTEISTPINGLNLGSADWVDYDSDGNMDLFITGFKIGNGDVSNGTFFRNTGGNFIKADITNIPRLIRSDHSWGHLDEDSLIDLVYSGTEGGGPNGIFSEAYINSNGTEFLVEGSSLQPLYFSDVSLIDLDSDGENEIFLSGYIDDQNYFSGIYTKENDSYTLAFEFEPIQTEYFGLKRTSRYNYTKGASWNDFDNDGDIDGIFAHSKETYFSGQSETSYFFGVSLAENLENLTFDLTKTGIPQYVTPSIDVFDFNNDNLLDIVITGELLVSNSNENSVFLTILKNDGDLQFSEHTTIELDEEIGTIDCGDYDNDGFSDILMSGFYEYEEAKLQILKNENGSSFRLLTIRDDGIHGGGAIWGNYDNDGDLDIFEYGTTSSSSSDAISRLYINNSSEENLPPSSPKNLSYNFENDTLIVSWEPSIDDKMGESGLSYEVKLGSSVDEFEIIKSLSTDSGKRQLIQLGNNGLKNNFKFFIEENGTYYFKVQAIDNAYNGSEFSDNLEICKPSVSLMDSLSICEFDSILIDAGNFNSYQWSSGEVTQTIYAKEEGWYSVEVLNSYGCTSLDSLYVSTFPPISLSIPDTTITESDIIEIDPGSYESYLWSNGYSERILTIDADTLDVGLNTFSLFVTDENGCGAESEFTVFVEDILHAKESLDFYSIRHINNNIILKNHTYGILNWKLYSLNGKVMNSGSIRIENQLIIPNYYGLYILSIEIGEHQFVEKLFIND